MRIREKERRERERAGGSRKERRERERAQEIAGKRGGR